MRKEERRKEGRKEGSMEVSKKERKDIKLRKERMKEARRTKGII